MGKLGNIRVCNIFALLRTHARWTSVPKDSSLFLDFLGRVVFFVVTGNSGEAASYLRRTVAGQGQDNALNNGGKDC